mmetsp:Transcript_32522/g.100643  ORF Transcript_32522/g.100643 Transcript_32522/m.100643 type:complete len:325 (+) Transcript_32522:260-1234(+)
MYSSSSSSTHASSAAASPISASAAASSCGSTVALSASPKGSAEDTMGLVGAAPFAVPSSVLFRRSCAFIATRPMASTQSLARAPKVTHVASHAHQSEPSIVQVSSGFVTSRSRQKQSAVSSIESTARITLSMGSANGRAARPTSMYRHMAVKSIAICVMQPAWSTGTIAPATPKTSDTTSSPRTKRRPWRRNGPYRGLKMPWCATLWRLLASSAYQSPTGVKRRVTMFAGGSAVVRSHSSTSKSAGARATTCSTSAASRHAHRRGTYWACRRLPVICTAISTEMPAMTRNAAAPARYKSGRDEECAARTSPAWVMGCTNSSSHT